MPKFLKSKTINFNAIYLALIAIIQEGFGVSLDPAIVAAVQTIFNWILRYVTKEPMSAK